MNIIKARRAAQIFFFSMFVWFCLVSTVGEKFWQWRGWPVNLLLQLDPLVALGTLLTTKTLYAGLLWALATICLTVFIGRFFCGWICPFGALHQFVGWLGRRGRKHAERVAMNQFRPAQAIKYYLLLALLAAAAGGLTAQTIQSPHDSLTITTLVLIASVLVITWLVVRGLAGNNLKRSLIWFAGVIVVWVVAGFIIDPKAIATASLQTGLLDPIPLIHRSFNLVVLTAFHGIGTASRFYVAAWSIALVFLAAVLLNLWIPRFYCRFICPLGALFGVLVRWTPWRIGKRERECTGCELCENNCEGACDPFGTIHTSECLLCMNCLHACRKVKMVFGPQRSASGEVESTGVTRRGFLVAATAGTVAVPAMRLGGFLDQNWDSSVVRPPGALAEPEFLDRCIKCGQCMRVCPTNVIQPALLEAGLGALWTPVLNFRIGSSGCQLNCVACGNICPTAAIRPLTLEEKLGTGDFAAAGPIRMGTAFVDRSRCLPWVVDTPCIVCQENCPVSPKAIQVREEFQIISTGVRTAQSASATELRIDGPPLRPGKLGTGDYFVRFENHSASERKLITSNTANAIAVAESSAWAEAPDAAQRVVLEVRLQKPVVNPEHCIGCGVCQHECPISGLRGIRVTAENESRNPKHSLTVKS